MSTLTLPLDQPVIIPESFLKALDLGVDDKVRIHLEGQRIIVEPASGEGGSTKLMQSEKTGRLILQHPAGAAPITMEMVNNVLHELP